MIGLVVLLCIGVLALAVWITTTLLDDESTAGAPPAKVDVPAVVGMTQSAAHTALQEAGLDSTVLQTPCQPGTEPACTQEEIGKVVATDPPASTPVEKGAKVTLLVGASPEQIEVPSLKGLTPQEAQNKLTTDKWGFQQATETIEVQDPGQVGKVVAQAPEAGTKAARGSTITVTLGRAPETAQLPDVTGQTLANARETLEGNGFKVQTKEVDSPEEQGRVVAQNPGPGRAEKGTLVTLSVSKNNQFLMPDLRGMNEGQARNKLAQAGWTGNELVVSDEPTNDISQRDRIIEQEIQPNTPTGKNARINVTKAEFSVGGGPTSTR
jgi:serine/threonine-protein kinase